ncbi:hypothetical protein ACLOJK_041153 [Asimina triloba]
MSGSFWISHFQLPPPASHLPPPAIQRTPCLLPSQTLADASTPASSRSSSSHCLGLPYSSSSPNVGQCHLRLQSDQRRLHVNVVFVSTSTACFGQIASTVSRTLFFLYSGEITSASLFRSPQPRPFLKSSSSYLLNLLFSSSTPVKLQRRLFFLFYSHLLLLPVSSIRIEPSSHPRLPTDHLSMESKSNSRRHLHPFESTTEISRKEEMEEIGSKSTEDINEEIIDLKGELFML